MFYFCIYICFKKHPCFYLLILSLTKFVRLSYCLSVWLCLSVCLSVCLSLCLSLCFCSERLTAEESLLNPWIKVRICLVVLESVFYCNILFVVKFLALTNHSPHGMIQTANIASHNETILFNHKCDAWFKVLGLVFVHDYSSFVYYCITIVKHPYNQTSYYSRWGLGM